MKWVQTVEPNSEWPFLTWSNYDSALKDIPRHLRCVCNHPRTERGSIESYASLTKFPTSRGRWIPMGFFCSECLLPVGTADFIKSVLFYCEGCGIQYALQGRKEFIPHRHKLCPKCSAKVPARYRKRKL